MMQNRAVPGLRAGPRFSVYRLRRALGVCTALVWLAATAHAAIPAPEKLLADDTVLMLTAPDFARLREIYNRMPESQFWNDPAMKAFRENFVSKWKEELVQPLERELQLKLDDYTGLLQGQVTFAMTQNSSPAKDEPAFGLLLLVDAKNKNSQLKKQLAELRKKWVETGKALKTERIRDIEFLVLPLASNDVPATLRKFLAASPPSPETESETDANKGAPKTELVVGQVESLLLLGNSLKAVEKVVGHLTGATLPTLGDSAAFQANYQALFRDAPLYGWVNAKVLLENWLRQNQKKDAPDAPPNPLDLKPDRLLEAAGLTSLKTVAFAAQDSRDGQLFQLYLGVPEVNRKGLFNILAGDPKEATPPAFVPADAVRFQRWRIDGQKAWTALQKMLAEALPQAAGGVAFLLDSADAKAKEADPSFDIRKNLFGNLGDDIVSYEKAPRDPSEPGSPPTLYLISSPRPELLAAAIKSLLVIVPQGDTITEREVLGRKVFSVPLPSLPVGSLGGPSKPTSPSVLTVAGSGAYVALSTDPAMVEEFLRSSEAQTKTLRETVGLTDAAQQVTGPGAYMFGYENQAETTRASFEAARKESASGTQHSPSANAAASLLPGAQGLPKAEEMLKSWMDSSLLPPFDKVSKYFSFTVYSASANVEGLTFKLFAPVPPGLKTGGGSK